MVTEAEASIRALSIKLLSRREHSAKELRQKLRMREFELQGIEAVIEHLQQQGLQSDARFAQEFVRSRYQRGYGPIKIEAELHERGVTDALVANGLQAQTLDWVASAAQLREKRFGAGLPQDTKLILRQKRYLQNRGFNYEQINQVFSRVAD